MIDDKPILQELTIVEKLVGKVKDLSNYLGKLFNIVVKDRLKSKFFLIPQGELVNGITRAFVQYLKDNKKAIVVTFDIHTRELIDKIAKFGIDESKQLYFIDCLSYSQGHGAPPVTNLYCINSPKDFDDIYMYSDLYYKKIGTDNTFVAIVVSCNLAELVDQNDAITFFGWFIKKIKQKDIPIIVFFEEGGSPSLQSSLFSIIKDDRRKTH